MAAGASGSASTVSARWASGPELIADAMRTSCEAHGMTLAYIEPGKPNQNAYLERFNRSFREEVLDAWVFTTLTQVRAVSEEWWHSYNTERSRESLGNVPPLTFLPRPTTVTPSNFKLCAWRGSLRCSSSQTWRGDGCRVRGPGRTGDIPVACRSTRLTIGSICRFIRPSRNAPPRPRPSRATRHTSP